MTGVVHSIMQFIALHAGWVFPVIFVVTFGESFAFVSFAFPGTTVLLAAGALIPTGALPLWPVLTGAIFGAVIGDAISYWLGLRYGHLLERRWPFTRHPEIMRRGYEFFGKHGGKSVFIGRFLGPLRAVVPLIAGITRMPRPYFWGANVLSAAIWAPALLLPGAAAGYAIGHVGLHHHWKTMIAVGAMVALAALTWLARWLGAFRRR